MPHNHPKHHNGVPYVDPHQPIIAVAPLNSVPYLGPPLVPENAPFPGKKKNNDGPAVVFLPSCPAEEDTKNILSSSKGGVVLTGIAALGKVGPQIGSLDIGESEDGYLFRVSLPGASTERNRFSCEIEPNGKMVIQGVTTTGGGIVRKHSQVFQMQTQNLCPPGEFSVTFMLPGPVDPKTFSGSLFIDGVLIGKVKKRAGEVL